MRAHHCTGLTLAELLVVCAVLAIAVTIALPTAQPVAEFRADTAAGEVAQALRYARAEAIRTNGYRMISCDTTSNKILVYIPDANGAFAAAVTDPMTKKDYAVVLDQAPAGSNLALASCSFVFADKTAATAVVFGADGKPFAAAKSLSALSLGTIQLGAGIVKRTVAVDAIGRVTTS
jgi:Tfp pilus assembly protein FimT